jgi:transcription initiation factor TFIID subunit 12
MNTGQGQPQGQPQPNAGMQQQQAQQQRLQQPPGQQQPQMQQQQGLLYRPEQIKNMVGLSPDERSKYAAGLEMLWQKVNTTPEGSPENKAARDKISNFSSMLTARLRDRKQKSEEAKAGQQGQPAQQAPQMAPKQAVPQQQQQQPPQAAAQAPGGQQQPQQAMANNVGGVPQSGNGVAPQQGGQTQTQPPQTNSLPESIAAHLRTIQLKTPPQLADKPNAEVQKWFSDMKTKYGRALFSLETSRAKVKAIDKQLTTRQQSGSPFTEEEMKKIMEQKTLHQKQQVEASRWVDTFRRQHIQDPSAANTNNAAGQKSDAAAPITAAAPQSMPQGNNNAAPSVATSAAPDAPKVMQQTPVPPPRVPPPSDNSANNQGPPQPALNPQPPAQPVQTPVPPPTQRPPPQPQQAPANNAQQQVAAAQNQAAQKVQTPQNTTPVNPGGPTRALSHSAAMTLANQRAATGSAPPQGQHAGTPTTAGPTSGPHPPSQQPQQPQHHGMQNHQSQQGHPHAHPPTQQQPMQSKMPIPKALPDKTTSVPQGVLIGGGVKPGRPTVSQGSGTLGGVMNQPAVNKIPAFNNEAEHDHVLSKKKLDELVRQVCGGASEGQEGNLLTPEVEEVSYSMET